MSNWDRLLEGRVKVEIKGHDIERFLNISSKRNLLIEQVYQNQFLTTPHDFKEMKTVARKTKVRLKVKGRQGLPFFLFQNRKRKLLCIGLMMFAFILFASSFYIWDISFIGNRRFTDDILSKYLESLSVHAGRKKSDIKCEDLEAEIRNTFSEITWVSVEIRGTRLIVNVKENEALTEIAELEKSPCDLVAGKRGIIKEVIVRNGFSCVKVGDIVEQGALLVDGTIPILDDAGNTVFLHETHADAEIIAETKHELVKKLALSRVEKVRTGEKRSGLYTRIFGYTIYLLPPSCSKLFWEFVIDQSQLCLLRNFYLPVYWGAVDAYEYGEYERFYTKEEVEKIGQRYLQEYKEKLSEKGVQILGNDGKIEGNESGWTITETLTVMENIAVEAKTSGKYEEN